jgi:hypothetical protein
MAPYGLSLILKKAQFPMKNLYSALLAGAFLLFASSNLVAQVGPGTIIRTATSVSGRSVLDPNTTYNFPGNSSKFSTGFGSDDVANSELPYKPIPALSYEPFADLRRGPNHSYSDFVPDGNDDGVYAWFDNTSLLFRFRMGSVMSGSKGYSVLLDTDGRFGSTGAAADPNYQAATTGTNGNPGFEIEIVLETNFQIAIYDVDGTSTPVLIKAYTNWQDMSQISIAATNDNGDPDFLMDFYIPFSDLQAAPFNLATATPIRLSATTVMAPKPAIGGPKSDIYGVNDEQYKNPNDAYEAFIKGQCGFSITSLQTASTCPVCTEAPVLNGPVSTGTVTISGKWVKSTLPGTQSTADITVYKAGTIVLGTVTNVASGSTWSLINVPVLNGDVITARAQAAGESVCLTSNAVIASSCNINTRPALPVLTCVTGGGNFNKGATGNNLSTGSVVYVENLTRNTIENMSANPGQFTTTGTSPNITWNYAGGCNGGPNMASGSYKVYYVNAAGCISEPAFFCVGGTGGTALAGTAATPVVTSPSNGITIATTSITGTGEPNGSAALFVNGVVVQTVTAGSGGGFVFSNLAFLVGQQVYITNIFTGTIIASKCLSTSVTYTVTCNSTAPLINTDAGAQIAAGAPVTGIASGAGDVVRVYLSPSTLVATTTALANGTWSTGNAGTTPGLYNAVSGSSYFATAQTGSCGVSSNSSTFSALTPTSTARCGTITGPVSPSTTSISGMLTGSFTSTDVTLYLDGTLIGTTTTNTAAWGPIAVNTADKNTALYSNGILTIGIKETGKSETLCAGSASAISCTPSAVTPVISPANATTGPNGTITYTISNAEAGTFYGLSDAATGESLGVGVWAPTSGSLSLTTKPLTTTKTYSVLVKATSLNGLNLCGSVPGTATIVVSSTLPVALIHFAGKKEGSSIYLQWEAEGATDLDHFIVERSTNGVNFVPVGREQAQPVQSRRSYSLKDVQPFAGINYYRLKMVDTDATYRYSRTLIFHNNNQLVPLLGPNPFTDKLSLYLSVEEAQVIKISLTDVAGAIIKEIRLSAAKGTNSFMINELQHLPQGLYIVNITTIEKSSQHKILKVK